MKKLILLSLLTSCTVSYSTINNPVHTLLIRTSSLNPRLMEFVKMACKKSTEIKFLIEDKGNNALYQENIARKKALKRLNIYYKTINYNKSNPTVHPICVIENNRTGAKALVTLSDDKAFDRLNCDHNKIGDLIVEFFRDSWKDDPVIYFPLPRTWRS